MHDDDPPANEGDEGGADSGDLFNTKLLAMAEVLGYSRDKLSAHIASGASMYMSPAAAPRSPS